MSTADDAPIPVTQQPTRARYWVIVFAVTLATIQYIDRVAISQAMPDIARDLTLSDTQKGMVFSAFTLAYASFEIPTGWLGDKFGARSVLLRVVIWWSFFTAATGWAWNYVSMLVMRFLFGAGEAGCFPNLTKALGAWLPKRDRTLAQALMWMGARWGGALAPLLVVIVMAFVSWRMAFMAFALLGVVWAIVFHWWFRDDPRQHKAVNAAELELLKGNDVNTTGHANVPWRELASRPALWLLWAQYFCLSYGWYFYVTWLPTYLRDERGMEIKTNAFMQLLGSGYEGLASLFGSTLSPDLTQKLLAASLAGIPLFFGGFGSLISGAIGSRLIASGLGVTRVRRSIACFGFIGASTLLMTSFYIKDPLLAMLSMGLASFCNDLTMPGSWATCMDIGGKYAGTVSGSMNMMGNFGGMAGPLVVGYVLSFTNRDWQLAFLISSVIYVLGAVFWLFIDPVSPLSKTEETAHS
jgi:ACS family glucarate transporter-like MFS transporter